MGILLNSSLSSLRKKNASISPGSAKTKQNKYTIYTDISSNIDIRLEIYYLTYTANFCSILSLLGLMCKHS